MAEALDYYTSYFDEGLSQTRLLDPGELESGFADGTYGSFISGPWHTGLVEDAGVTHGPVRRRAAARPGRRARHVVRRRRRPRRLQRLRQRRQRLEVRAVAEPSPRPSRRSTTRSATCRPSQAAWETGELAEDPQLQVFGEQLENAAGPAGRPDLGAGRRRRSTRSSSRPRRATCPARTPPSRCSPRPRRSAPVSDMSTTTADQARTARPASGRRGSKRRARPRGTWTPRGGSRLSPRGSWPCRSWRCSWCSPPGRCWPASA